MEITIRSYCSLATGPCGLSVDKSERPHADNSSDKPANSGKMRFIMFHRFISSTPFCILAKRGVKALNMPEFRLGTNVGTSQHTFITLSQLYGFILRFVNVIRAVHKLFANC